MSLYRAQLRKAAAWHIISELMRRYEASHNLRVIETHPGGGQYDCLSLFRVSNPNYGVYRSNAAGQAEHLCDFNSESQNLHLWYGSSSAPARPSQQQADWEPPGDYVNAFVHADDPIDVIDEVARRLVFPPMVSASLPATSRRVLVVRLLAACLSSLILSRISIEVRMGYLDSSGYSGSGVRSDLKRFMKLSDDESVAGIDAASECWLLYFCRDDSLSLAGCLTGAGVFISSDDPQQSIELMTAYETHGRSVRKLAGLVLDVIGVR